MMKLVNYVHSINFNIDMLIDKKCFWILWIVNCYIYIYIYGCTSLNWYDDLIICSYTTILVEMKPMYWDWKEIKVPWLHMYLYDSEQLNWYDMWYEWMMNTYINSYDWNEIRVLEIKKKSRYWDCIWIYVVWLKLVWVKWSMYDWNELKMTVIENKSMCGLYK